MRGIEQLLGNCLGSGCYGSVYSARRKGLVVKITSDAGEAVVARRLLAQAHPGFVQVHAVADLGDESGRHQWLILRERADGDVPWQEVEVLRTELEKQGFETGDVVPRNVGWVKRGKTRHPVVRDLGGVTFPAFPL